MEIGQKNRCEGFIVANGKKKKETDSEATGRGDRGGGGSSAG